MNKAFEKILERLEEKLRKSEKRYYRYLDDSNLSCIFDRSDIEEKRVDTIKEMLEIVKEVAEEYSTDLCSRTYNKAIDDMYNELQDLLYHDFNITLERLYKTKDSLINGGNNDI